MNKLISILLFVLLTSCTPIYYLKNKKQILENDKQIKGLTALIDKNDYKEFLSRLTIDNKLIYYGTDTLGFNYYRQHDHRCLNDEVCFSTSLILYNDSILSISATPSFFKIRPIISTHYKKTLKACGWVHEHRNYFKSKFCNYSASTVPLKDPELNFKPEINSHLDSLISPFNHNRNSNYLSNLTTDELFYLLHSINPYIRAGVIRHIKCNAIQTTEHTEKWIETVKNNSPLMRTMLSECIIAKMPIEYFLNCDTK